MFLKRINAKSKEGRQQTYWALVKSVRTARGPRHQVVSYLGELQADEKSEWANLARIVNKRPIPRTPLFDTVEATEPVPETIEVRVRGARRTIHLRCVTTPDDAQKVLLNRLGLTLPQRLRRIDEVAQM